MTDLGFPPVLDMIAPSKSLLMCHLSGDILRILRSLSDWICSRERGSTVTISSKTSLVFSSRDAIWELETETTTRALRRCSIGNIRDKNEAKSTCDG